VNKETSFGFCEAGKMMTSWATKSSSRRS